MFQTNYGVYTPDTWEDTCQLVFKIAYKEEDYQKMPDANGDLGIEGFTLKTGKAFQCYCPEDNIKGKELYEALRGKITKDIGKLEKNCVELKAVLGDVKIGKWYLVTPKSADKKIFAHCRKKEKEILSKGLDILSSDFKILIHEVEDYVTYLKFTEDGVRYDVSIEPKEKTEWISTQNKYVENANRKYTKVYDEDYNDLSELEKSVLQAVDISIMRYLKGKKQLDFLRINHPRDFERLKKICSQLEEDVVIDSLSKISNKKKFIKDLTNDVELKINNELKGFDTIMIKDLANQVVSSWVLECSLNFN